MATLTPTEFAAQMYVPPSLLNAMADEQRQKIVQRTLTHSMVEFLVVNGKKTLTSRVDAYTDPSLRGSIELNAWGEAIPEETLIALIARQDAEQRALMNALETVNSISWWRFLWLKIKGRKLVTYA